MVDSIKLPPDLLQLPPFRQLEVILNGRAPALLAWWTLFGQLKYLAQEGVPAGRVPQDQVEIFKKTLEEVAKENGLTLPEGKNLFKVLAEEVRLLRADGPDWVCARYQVLNAEQYGKGLASLGGSMKAYRKKQSTLDRDATQQSLNIHESKFVDEAGVALGAEDTRRVTRLIIACDSALFKPQRPPQGFTEGLIQTALQIVRHYKDEDVDYVCEQVALHRNHPLLTGFTTDRLLPEFGNMVRGLAK